MNKPSIRKMRRNAAYAGFHQFRDEVGCECGGSFEVFFVDAAFVVEDGIFGPDEYGPGWYWQARFPGCLPDGEACGPFTSSRAAWRDACGF